MTADYIVRNMYTVLQVKSVSSLTIEQLKAFDLLDCISLTEIQPNIKMLHPIDRDAFLRIMLWQDLGEAKANARDFYVRGRDL